MSHSFKTSTETSDTLAGMTSETAAADVPRATIPPPTVWPCLSYRDAPAAIAWLQDALGFRATSVHTAPDDETTVEHAELAWPPGGGIMLGSPFEQEGWPDRVGGNSCYLVSDEVDALFERAVAAGAKVLREPRDEDYGGRDFVVLDPEGNLWSVGSYRGQ
jgi:uncharacterized glyoxalase superfamily protein PhnB